MATSFSLGLKFWNYLDYFLGSLKFKHMGGESPHSQGHGNRKDTKEQKD